jgi:uncharacterized protein YigE (DUF2233 family)
MTTKLRVLLFAFGSGALLLFAVLKARPVSPAPAMVSYTADLRRVNLQLYWKNEQGQRFGSLANLKNWLAAHNQPLVFAMNGGMFTPRYSPQGLFIEQQTTVAPLDTTSGAGNFYLKPNGIFYTTTANTAHICRTADFCNDGRVACATQSGPMLLIDGRIHPAFQPGSANRQIRNGVGILPGNQVLFAMSKTPVSFYEFADYFRKAGCHNALYLDGFVSRTYAPAAGWMQTDGDFGVIIGITDMRQ